MNRKITVLVVLIVMLLIPIGLVGAQGDFRSPDRDTTCYEGSGCFDTFELDVEGSQSSVPVCSGGRVPYIAWDLANDPLIVGKTINSARLILTAVEVSGVPAGDGVIGFDLVEPINHAWGGNDAAIGLTANVIASTVATLTNSTTDLQPIIFEGDAMGAYFESLRAGDASVAVVMTSGCGAVSTLVRFRDTDPALVDVNEPNLIFFPDPGPTAVSMSETATTGTSASPLLWGALALVVVTLGGLFVMRKRDAEVNEI